MSDTGATREADTATSSEEADTATNSEMSAFLGGIPSGSTVETVIELIKGAKDIFDAKDVMVVEVVNETNVPLFLSNRSNETTLSPLPQLRIDPDETDVFVSFEEPGSGPSGAKGELTYNVGNPEARWKLEWLNANVILGLGADNDATSEIEGPQSEFYNKVDQNNDIDDIAAARFTIRGNHPNPGTGGKQMEAKILVVNNTAEELVFLDADHNDGEFKGAPPAPTVEPNDNTEFVSGSDEENPEGADGYVRYQLREDEPDFWWDVVWNVPVEGEITVAVARHGGRADEFKDIALVANADPNEIELRFRLEQVVDPGGPGGGGEPVDFEFPVEEAEEPTLRRGMQGEDGWVEYLQRLLNFWGEANEQLGEPACPNLAPLTPLVEDGDFGNGTHQAVVAFQTDRGLMVDGICGNQTWSELKQEPPQAPGTDGREPGTYQEEGPEARWITEESAVRPLPDSDIPDAFVAKAWNVGNIDLNPGDFEAYAYITNLETGESGERLLEINSRDGMAEVGSQFGFVYMNFREEFGAGRFHVLIIMPQELGGDEADGEFEMPEN